MGVLNSCFQNPSESSGLNGLMIIHLNPCLLVLLLNFYDFMSSADFFQNQLFQKNLSGLPSVSKSLDPNMAQLFVGPNLGPNCLQRLSADGT